MALSYGFFNSLDGDRLYDAEEFSSFLDGIVYDGIYQAVGNKFYVEANEGMKVTVDSGRAWFNHTWTLNTGKYLVEMEPADSVYDRIDAVVLEINKTDRRNYIKAIKGQPAQTPSRPLLIKSEDISQYALAYITVKQNTSVIYQGDIEYVVDTSETPLCSALALAGIPSGGTIGQVLAKKSSESGVVGWYDIDKLPFENWYLADGIGESNVLGAYKLSRTLDEATALVPVNDNKTYTLAKVNSPAWNNANGFTIEAGTGLNNAAMRNAAPASAILYLNNVNHAGEFGNRAPFAVTGCQNGDYTRCLFLSLPYVNSGGYWTASGYIGAYMRYGVERNDGNWLKFTNQTWPTNGVIGVTWNSTSSCTIYLNGLALGTQGLPSNFDSSTASSVHSEASMLVGSTHNGMSDSTSKGRFTVSHAVYYNVALTAAQHYEIAKYMISDRAS